MMTNETKSARLARLIAAEERAYARYLASDASKGGIERYDSKEYNAFRRATAAVNNAKYGRHWSSLA